MYHKDIGSCEMYRHKTNARVQIPEGEKFMNERNVRPFSKRDEIGYVFGDMAGSFVNLFVDAYFLTFCTYVQYVFCPVAEDRVKISRKHSACMKC
jgi:GPH family glycoside/pentoside/hexuronide:cation symporter